MVAAGPERDGARRSRLGARAGGFNEEEIPDNELEDHIVKWPGEGAAEVKVKRLKFRNLAPIMVCG